MQVVCLYIALKNTIDLLNFGDSFDESLGDVSDKKTSTLTTLSIPLSVNPNLPWNLFVAKDMIQDTGLDIDSIANFKIMQSSIPLELDTNNLQLYPRWKHIIMFSLNTSTPGFNKIQKSIKFKFLLNPKPWQVSVVADITKTKKDVVVIANISASKSLSYQSISIITREIVLIVSPTIILIKDQVSYLLVSVSHISFAKSIAKRDYLFELNITVVAFITITIKSNPQI